MAILPPRQERFVVLDSSLCSVIAALGGGCSVLVSMHFG